jgi:hypothetical protein
MLVYRVENADGEGPYAGFKTTDLSRHYNTDTHPGPYYDNIPSVHSYHRFGFSSAEKFVSWFNEDERASLAGDGYRMSIYDVDPAHVIHGRKQVVFEAAEATLFETLDLITLAPIGSEQLMAA